MWPDLGKYAGAVLGSYGAAIALLAGLVVASILQGRQVKRALAEAEARAAKAAAQDDMQGRAQNGGGHG